MNKNKIVLVIIILITVIVGGVFLVQAINQGEEEEINKEVKEKDENLEPVTYRSEEFNFGFELPPEFFYKDMTDLYKEAPEEVDRDLVLLIVKESDESSACASQDPPISRAAHIKVFDNQNMLSAEEWFDKKRKAIDKTSSVFLIYEGEKPKERFKVDGQEALEFERYNNHGLRKLVVFTKEDKVFLTSYNPTRFERIPEDCKQELDEVLNTIFENFNFIK